MPKKKKAARPMRVAERVYRALGATSVTDLSAAQEEWEDDELFIIAHLLYLNLQALDDLRRQGQRIGAMLKDIEGDTEKLADVAELAEAQIQRADDIEDDSEDDDGGIEDDDGGIEDDDGGIEEPAPSPPALPVEVVTPPAKGKGSRKKSPLTHPVPDAPTPDGAA